MCGCKKLYDDIMEAYFSDTQLNIKNGIVKVENKEQYLQKANELIPREFRYKNNFNSKFEGMYKAFICARSWFGSFGTFEMFCKQFKLSGKGNFVDENYKVNIMTALFPILPNDYEEYIENVCSTINVRNSLINP